MTDLPVPLVPDMIHRPEAPAHMMRVKPAGRRVTVRLGEDVLAVSDSALRVIEIGRDVYDPILYLPRADVSARLGEAARTTHCPLKGDTTYFDIASAPEIAWSYTRPLPFADGLRDHVAFDPARVTIEEGPLGAPSP